MPNRLKQEKEDLARQVEFEEEMITNKLSKKLEQVKQEKVNLENLLEQEQVPRPTPHASQFRPLLPPRAPAHASASALGRSRALLHMLSLCALRIRW